MQDMTPTASVRRRKRAVYVVMGLLAAFPSASGASGEAPRPSVPGWTSRRGDGYPQVRLPLSGQWRPASVDVSCVEHPNGLFHVRTSMRQCHQQCRATSARTLGDYVFSYVQYAAASLQFVLQVTRIHRRARVLQSIVEQMRCVTPQPKS